MIKVLIIAIAVLIIGGLGWMIFKPTPEGSPVLGVAQDSNQLISPEPDLTRVKLQNLLNQHGLIASNHLSALYDGKDTGKTSAELEENNQEIADFVSDLGAPKEQFLAMWQDHVKGYENYTKALKEGDSTGTAAAKVNLDTQAEHMGEMISKLFPSISAQRGSELMKEHIDLTLNIVELHAKDDETEKAVQITKAASQATKFANELADGLEKSNQSQ